MSHHPKQSEIQRFYLQFGLIHDPREQDHQFLQLVVRSRVNLSGFGFVELQNAHVFTTRETSRTVLQLRKGHMIMLQMKVSQISLIQ